MAYSVKKIDGQWRAVDEAGRVQFSSLRRINASDWVKMNNPKDAPKDQQGQQPEGQPQQAT